MLSYTIIFPAGAYEICNKILTNAVNILRSQALSLARMFIITMHEVTDCFVMNTINAWVQMYSI